MMGVCGKRRQKNARRSGAAATDPPICSYLPRIDYFPRYTYSRRPSGSQSGPPARYGGQPSRGLFAQLPELAGMNTGLPTEAHARNKRERRLVRKKGLEPSRYCYRQPLKLVDLLCRCELPRILLTDPDLKWTPANARDDFIGTNSHARWGKTSACPCANGRLMLPAISRRPIRAAVPDASRLDGDDRALDECGAMRVDRRDRRRAVVSGSDVHQSKDASMGKASDDRQFAEVLVERDHGLLMFRGVREDRQFSGISYPVGDRLGFVAGASKGDLR